MFLEPEHTIALTIYGSPFAMKNHNVKSCATGRASRLVATTPRGQFDPNPEYKQYTPDEDPYFKMFLKEVVKRKHRARRRARVGLHTDARPALHQGEQVGTPPMDSFATIVSILYQFATNTRFFCFPP